MKLVFSNADSCSPKNILVNVGDMDSVRHIMDWYGSYFAGDRYTVTLDGRNIKMDINGEMICEQD